MLLNIEIIVCGKCSVYIFNCYNDVLKMVVVKYYYCFELVDDFNYFDDIIFKFGFNVLDSLILEIQLKLYVVLGDMVIVVVIGYGSIDLIILGVYKVNGLCILQQCWGIEDYEVVVFGDSGNDIEMLQYVGFGFVMVNVWEDVKVVVCYQVLYNNEEGVLQIIDKVLDCEVLFV